MSRPERVGLALVLLVYTGLALGYAWFTPPWNNPDEPAHYNYVAFVAERHALPELVSRDWDQDLLNRAIPERFHPRLDVSALRYESHQPPLYYLLAAPVYSATSGASLRVRVLVLRAVSIGLGILFGLVVYRLARESTGGGANTGILATAIALLIPMVTASAASINNDLLSMFLAAATTLILVRWTRWWHQSGTEGLSAPPVALALQLGILLGLLLLTKLTVYVVVLMAVGIVLLVTVRQKHSVIRSRHASRLMLSALVTVMVSGWWFVRSASIYGWEDVLAQRRHDAVVIGQPRYADLGLDNWIYLTVTVFHSFFAQFGWMAIVVDNLIYGLYGGFVLLALYGLWTGRSASQAKAMMILWVSLVLAAGQLLYYNLSFIQAQGRYLFPALGAIAVILSVGWLKLAWPQRRIVPAIAILWASLALATAVGGINDWDLGLKSVAVFALLTAALGYGYVRISANENHQKADSSRVQAYLVGMTIFGLAALNLTCLTRYVIPFYRG